MDTKTNLLLNSLKQFYRGAEFDQLREVLNKKSVVSLRMLDWLVTNYARKTHVIYDLPCEDGSAQSFNLFLSYKTQLRAYSKKRFDPFRRRERLMFKHDGESLLTTIAQLNFFRWCIENKVLDFASEHHKAIEDDMMQSMRTKAIEDAEAKENKQERKRRKVDSSGIAHRMMIRHGSVQIKFN